MDDGTKRVSGYALCTAGFSDEEQGLLVDALSKSLGIQVTIQGSNYKALYVGAGSAGRFRDLVGPFVKAIPSMEYKL